MRGIVALIGVAVASVLLWSSASAETPTPTPGPTVAPRSSTITIHNVYDGVPFVDGVLGNSTVSLAYVSEQLCDQGVGIVLTQAGLLIQTSWPWKDHYPCNAVGLPVRICATFGHCTDDFIFEGADVSVDLEWSAVFPQIPTVTGHFVQGGVPHEVTVTAWRETDIGGTVPCGGGSNSPVRLTEIRSLNWGGSAYCRAVVAKFTTAEYGVLEATYRLPESGDFDYFIEVPAAASSSPTAPALLPLSTPGSLPQSGGARRTGTFPTALFAGVAVVLLGAGMLIWRRYRV